jgi:hypothetical protein
LTTYRFARNTLLWYLICIIFFGMVDFQFINN